MINPTLEQWISKYFAAYQRAEAMDVLSGYGSQSWHREPERVKRDMVIVSRGSMDKLKELFKLANMDYRDILIGEEVDPWLIGELKGGIHD